MPETSIVITAQDRYSEAIKKMSTTTQSFKKNVDSLEDDLQLLSKTKTTLRLDVKDAKRALDEAEKQFRATHSEADGLKLELAQANYDGTVRQLNLVTKTARDTEKQLSKTSSKAGGSGRFGQNVINALAISGIGDAAKKLLSDGANAAAGSLWGSEGGTLFSNALSTAATGASAGFMMGGPFGAVVGGLLGAGAGFASGSIQNWSKKDDFFKAYIQDSYDTVTQEQTNSLTTGSTIAAGRETDRVSFTTLFGDTGIANTYLDNLVEMANNTPFLYGDLTAMSKTLATYGYSAQADQEKALSGKKDYNYILDVLQTIGDAGAALGQSTGDMEAVATAIGRMKSSNKATLEYLNILNDRGIGAVGMLAEAKGVNQGTMYDMISKGKVSGQEAAEIILQAMTDSFSGSMLAQSGTFSGLTSTVEGLTQELDNAMGQGYNEGRMKGLTAQREAA